MSINLSVSVPFPVLEDQFVFITGSSIDLGSWNARKALKLKKVKDGLWVKKIYLSNSINFIYFIGTYIKTENANKNLVIFKWEEFSKPRCLTYNGLNQALHYVFGEEGEGNVDNFVKKEYQVAFRIPGNLCWKRGMEVDNFEMVTQEAYDRVVERRDQLQAANANLTERFNDAQREIEHLRNQNAVLINTNAMLVGLLRDNQNMQQQNPPNQANVYVAPQPNVFDPNMVPNQQQNLAQNFGPPPYQYMHQLQLYDPGQQQNFGRRSNGKNLLCISSSRSTSSGLTQSSIKKPQYLDSRKFRFELLDNIDTFVFDADGVLWLDENEIGGSVSFIEYIAKLGKKIIILTNNAIKSRAVYANELTGFGYGRYINGDNVVNPAAVIADLIHRSALVNKGKKVYLIGSQCLKYELDVLNIDYFCDGTDLVDIQSSSNSQAFKIEEHPDNVGAVVVGFDKYCNVLNLMKAANYLKNEDCLFFATTEEETCPCPNLTTIGAAPLVAAVKTASGREPLIVGKSSAPAFEFICRLCGVDDPRRILMIGDRLNTEVKFEYDNGLRTLLVFSQCHGLDVIEDGIPQSRDDLVPEFYAECLGALIPKSENN